MNNNTFKGIFTDAKETIKREKYRLGFLILLAILISLIYTFYANSDKLKEKWADTLLHIVPEIIGAILIFLLLDAGIEKVKKLTTSGIQEEENLPMDKFIEGIRVSRNIKILDISPVVLLSNEHRTNFKEALEYALGSKKNVDVKILIAHPDSNGMQQRIQEIGENTDRNYSKEMNATLIHLKRIHEDFSLLKKNQNLRNAIPEIFLYHSLPPFALYQLDETAYFSFYPKNNNSTQDIQLVVPVTSQLGKYLNDKFDELWDINNDNVSIRDEKIEEYLESVVYGDGENPKETPEFTDKDSEESEKN